MANLFDIFSKTAEKVIGDIDLTPAMIYLFDAVNANALPALASQFDVEGFKGWDLAITEKQKRELLKTVMEIKSHLGTPFAIKRSLAAIGFSKVTIQEGIGTSDGMFYDGVSLYDGSIKYGGFDWSAFTVTIKTKYSVLVSNETKELVTNLILYYKNARSKLVNVIYQEDSLFYYDGTLIHNGSINY